MIGKLLKKIKEQETYELLTEGNFNAEVYNYLNAVVKLDANGNFLSCNQAFINQFGYDEKDFKESFFDVFFKYHVLEIIRCFEKALMGKIQKFDTLSVTKDKKNVEIKTTFIPYKNNKEVIAILNNITEFQQQSKELNQLQKMRETFGQLDQISNYYYDAINDYHYFSSQIIDMLKIKTENDNPDVGIWAIDVQYENTIKISKGIEYITGYTTEDFKNGLQWESIVHRDDLQSYIENQTKLAEGNIIHNQYRIINKMRDRRWIQDYVIPTLDSNGNLVRLNGLITEITEKKY